jgi:hypothetical protein
LLKGRSFFGRPLFCLSRRDRRLAWFLDLSLGCHTPGHQEGEHEQAIQQQRE